MTDSMNFGPDWIRNMSSEGNTLNVGGAPPIKCHLAEYRYGREEMLALFDKGYRPPPSLLSFTSLYSEQTLPPLALIPPTENEQCMSGGTWVNTRMGPPTMGGVNTSGAGTRSRGGGSVGGGGGGGGGGIILSVEHRGGRGNRGRGGGAVGGYSNVNRTYDGGWNNTNSGNGYGSEVTTEWSPRKDVGGGGGRAPLPMDNWRRSNRIGSAGGVNSNTPDDENNSDGWRMNTSTKGMHDKFARTASWRFDVENDSGNTFNTSRNTNWHDTGSMTDGSKMYPANSNRPPPNRVRSYSGSGNPSWDNQNHQNSYLSQTGYGTGYGQKHVDNLPEWATENLSQVGGTFDDRGAFHGPDNKSNEDSTSVHQRITHNEVPPDDNAPTAPPISDQVLLSSQKYVTSLGDGDNAELAIKKAEPGHSLWTNTEPIDLTTRPNVEKPLESLMRPNISKPSSDSTTEHPPNSKDSNSARTTDDGANSMADAFERLHEDFVLRLVDQEDNPTPTVNNREARTNAPDKPTKEPASLSYDVPNVPEVPNTQTNTAKCSTNDQTNFTHPFVKLLMESTLRSQPSMNTSDTTTPQTATSMPKEEKWFYKDPNNVWQGPFSHLEMAAWYKAGVYFTPQLLVRRQCDENCFLLGDLISRCGSQNPFLATIPIDWPSFMKHDTSKFANLSSIPSATLKMPTNNVPLPTLPSGVPPISNTALPPPTIPLAYQQYMTEMAFKQHMGSLAHMPTGTNIPHASQLQHHELATQHQQQQRMLQLPPPSDYQLLQQQVLSSSQQHTNNSLMLLINKLQSQLHHQPQIPPNVGQEHVSRQTALGIDPLVQLQLANMHALQNRQNPQPNPLHHGISLSAPPPPPPTPPSTIMPPHPSTLDIHRIPEGFTSMNTKTTPTIQQPVDSQTDAITKFIRQFEQLKQQNIPKQEQPIANPPTPSLDAIWKMASNYSHNQMDKEQPTKSTHLASLPPSLPVLTTPAFNVPSSDSLANAWPSDVARSSADSVVPAFPGDLRVPSDSTSAPLAKELPVIETTPQSVDTLIGTSNISSESGQKKDTTSAKTKKKKRDADEKDPTKEIEDKRKTQKQENKKQEVVEKKAAEERKQRETEERKQKEAEERKRKENDERKQKEAEKKERALKEENRLKEIELKRAQKMLRKVLDDSEATKKTESERNVPAAVPDTSSTKKHPNTATVNAGQQKVAHDHSKEKSSLVETKVPPKTSKDNSTVSRMAPWSQSSTVPGYTLTEIQKMEKVNRAQQLLQMQQQQQQQQQMLERQQQDMVEDSYNWVKKKKSPAIDVPTIKTLTEIQAEEHEQLMRSLAQQRERELQQQSAALAAQQSSGGGAANSSSRSGGGSIWNGQNLTWATAATQNTAHTTSAASTTGGFWDEPTTIAPVQSHKATVTTAKPSAVAVSKTTSSQTKTKSATAAPGCAATTATATKKDVTKTKQADDFYDWCKNSLAKFKTEVDIPTFVSFLVDIESAYDVRDYCKEYLGDDDNIQQFVKDFVDKRRLCGKKKLPLMKDDMGSPAPAITPQQTNQSNANNGEFQEVIGKGKNKKNKRSKMCKVDSRILGFNVTSAPNRINVGDRDYGDNS